MSDFLSLEASAEQLGVSDAQLRLWIKRGLARATRRGGDYALRPAEVKRLREDLPPIVGDSQEDQNPSPQRPRVLPPRSEKNPDSFAGERDRRRRMGRRASDFTLEILHHEIKSAITAALEPILPQLEDIQKSIGNRPVQATTPQEVVGNQHDIESMEGRILELESQIRHQELAREEFRHRLEESERQRHELEQVGRQAQQHEDGTQQLLQRLSKEVGVERQLRMDAQEQLQSMRLESKEQLERARSEMGDLQSSSMSMDAERARWNLEIRSLQGEIDRLTSMQDGWDAQKREMEQAQHRLQLMEKTGGDSEKALEERENEIRRLREQVTSLTYRLQMAGTGATGTSPEESRRLVERLAEAQAEMSEKNELINQNYAEMGELRSKLDDIQRSNYELQGRYNRLEDEWAQQAARQMSDHQQHQQQPPPPTNTGERPKGWGNLFGRRE